MPDEVVKLIIGNYRYPVTLRKDGNQLWCLFPYNKKLLEEIKSMEGSKWHGFEDPPIKAWTIADSPRNRFQLAILQGQNPFGRYDAELIKLPELPRLNREVGKELMPRQVQFEMASHIITRKQAVIAGEMGTGKTLAAIMAMEWAAKELGIKEWWYIANKAGVRAIERELWIWNSGVMPTRILTYEAVVRDVARWRDGDKAPQGIILDESTKIKNPAAKRTRAASHLVNSMRQDHGDENVFAVLMSGSPAPKSPADYWSQCEIACPGFLREGSIEKFKKRLAIIVNKENILTGGVYPEMVSWLDDERRCAICGQYKEHGNHDPQSELMGKGPPHEWRQSVNEVAKLYDRMKGLVLVRFKRECLSDLPEKQYKIIRLKPSKETLRAASLVAETASTVIEGLTLMREMSDGFIYKNKLIGTVTCPVCKGAKTRIQSTEIPGSCPNCPKEGECLNHQPRFEDQEAACDGCNAVGEKPSYERTTVEVPCPKEDAVKELLDDFEDVGRAIFFAGFIGSIDRLSRIAREAGWHVVLVDGRGWRCYAPDGSVVDEDPITMFQQLTDKYERVAYIGHAKSGGTSVTLTRSPVIVYYSNSFDFEDRIQSEDRIHRLGMDVNKGATIIDLFHLPTDEHVYNNLKKKRELQSMSLGEFAEVLKKAEHNERSY